ncbi:PIN domain-containing protein [Eudoraea chungangensis]|uniref:PIN domain-containing protein n=1 Tax=Eudoraea chungangensis TaxID=1481905 RepID=UPI0023EC26AA|nr:PIN domain-containing protein [Eudoraea chungangensis]
MDTNVFQSQNFTTGRNLNDLLKISNEQEIQICIVDITYRECLKRIESNLTKSKTAVKKIIASLNKDCNILRQLDHYKPFFEIPKVDVGVEYSNMKEIFDEFLSDYKVEIVNSDIANHVEVFDQYFNKEKPFGLGQKKDEFPDAFIINTIEHWCKLNNVSTFVISSDNDMIDYKSKNFDVIESLGEMLHHFATATELNERVDNLLMDNIGDPLEELISHLKINTDEVTLLLYQRLLTDPYYVGLEYEPGDVKDTHVDSLIITSIEENTIQAELRVKIIIQIPFTYNDLSLANYDSEDDRYWNIYHVSENSIYELDLSLMTEFIYEIEGDEVLEFSFDSIYDYSLNDFDKIEENIDSVSEFED